MTVSEASRRVLSLAFTESLAGEEIPASYNNQADLIRAIPGLLGSALSLIVSACGGLPASVPVSSLSASAFSGAVSFPSDCVRPVALWSSDGSRRFPAAGLPGALAVPAGLEDGILEYRRRPRLPSLDALPSEELDGTPEMQNAALLWAASQLLLSDDPFRASFLNKQYESALSRLPSALIVSPGTVEDSYAFPVSVY